MAKVMHLMHRNAKNRTRQQERVWYLNLSTNDKNYLVRKFSTF